MSSISIIHFEQVNISWGSILVKKGIENISLWSITKVSSPVAVSGNGKKYLLEEYSLQKYRLYSKLKRRGNDCFHVVSTWNTCDVFVRFYTTRLEANDQLRHNPVHCDSFEYTISFDAFKSW